MTIVEEGVSSVYAAPGQRGSVAEYRARYGHYIGGAEHSVTILEQAPAVILVVNTNSRPVTTTVDVEERIAQNCDIQAIGAAIQNMLLAPRSAMDQIAEAIRKIQASAAELARA